MLLQSSQYQLLPSNPGIYLFLNKENKILYVGKAKNLKKRVNSYFAKYAELGPKTRVLVSNTDKIKAIIVPSEIEALLVEANYIKKYKPKYNIKLTDGKNYPLVRIVKKDQYPKILIARRIQDKNSIYFGPFPNSSAMNLVLKTIRRIFPYQSVTNHPKKVCLYYHLGLCPCPPVFNTKGDQEEYGKNINHIIDFLNGKSKKILRELTKERKELSKKEEYEKANLVQNKIKAIEIVTGPYYEKSWNSDINPNLNDDQRFGEIGELIKILKNNKVNVENLDRIECYDISNISGTNATGSMVVFTDGEKDSRWYRKFKIRRENTPNDFAMMQEVLQRRLSHNEWPEPSLIIVDGGKGQISSAVKALTNSSKKIPLVGLAKREETIITTDFKEISLPNDSGALKLVMRIRDEAHRFAITYHRKLRSKNFLV